MRMFTFQYPAFAANSSPKISGASSEPSEDSSLMLPTIAIQIVRKVSASEKYLLRLEHG